MASGIEHRQGVSHDPTRPWSPRGQQPPIPDRPEPLAARPTQAVADADGARLHVSADTLKGAIRYFGCDQAFDYAFQLERMGLDGQLDQSRALLALLETEIQQIFQALSEYIERGSQV